LFVNQARVGRRRPKYASLKKLEVFLGKAYEPIILSAYWFTKENVRKR
jgi:hypothetical protein